MQFLQFCADLRRKSKSNKPIYIYASKRSRYALCRYENDIVHYAMTYCFEDIRVWSARTLLNFCWVSTFFDILIANISWTVAQSPIIFWKSVVRTFICIYVNCFNRLRFFAEVSTKLQKMLFFRQFKKGQ